jgi:ribose transport system ATP-binding protein
MRELASKRYAILFYSSDLSELVHMANRVMVMRQGKVAAELKGEEISEKNMLRAAVLETAA